MSTAVTEAPPTKEIASEELRVSDRCDRRNCNAQTRCRAIFENGTFLDFCYHHYNELEEAIEQVAAFVIDEREKIE